MGLTTGPWSPCSGRVPGFQGQTKRFRQGHGWMARGAARRCAWHYERPAGPVSPPAGSPRRLQGAPARSPLQNPFRQLPYAFRALRHRNFQLFWAGQGLSVVGTWLQLTAQGWLVYRLTHSPLVLGILTVFRFLPAVVIAPFAGLVADRFPRRRVVLLTQGASLVLASILAALTLTGRIRVPK